MSHCVCIVYTKLRFFSGQSNTLYKNVNWKKIVKYVQYLNNYATLLPAFFGELLHAHGGGGLHRAGYGN